MKETDPDDFRELPAESVGLNKWPTRRKPV
jgi:hypothetical protein